MNKRTKKKILKMKNGTIRLSDINPEHHEKLREVMKRLSVLSGV